MPRIIHDIDMPASVSGGTNGPYAKRKDQEMSSGFRCNLLFMVPNPFDDEEEAIHIEGDGAYVLDALYSAIEIVEAVGRSMASEGLIPEDWKARVDRTRDKMKRALEESESKDDE